MRLSPGVLPVPALGNTVWEHVSCLHLEKVIWADSTNFGLNQLVKGPLPQQLTAVAIETPKPQGPGQAVNPHVKGLQPGLTAVSSTLGLFSKKTRVKGNGRGKKTL